MLVKEYLAERARQGPSGARLPLLVFSNSEEMRGWRGPAKSLPRRERRRALWSWARSPCYAQRWNQVGLWRRLGNRRSKRWRASVASTAAANLGGADWERDLIKAARSKDVRGGRAFASEGPATPLQSRGADELGRNPLPQFHERAGGVEE